MNPTPELEQAVAIALNLSPLDKVRLVEQIMAPNIIEVVTDQVTVRNVEIVVLAHDLLRRRRDQKRSYGRVIQPQPPRLLERLPAPQLLHGRQQYHLLQERLL